MRLTARGRAGHGSMVHDDNAVTAIAGAVDRLGRHQFPLVLNPAVEEFLTAVAEETGYDFDVNSPDLEGTMTALPGAGSDDCPPCGGGDSVTGGGAGC